MKKSKLILKICGFVLLGLLGIVAVAFGIGLIKGSFKDKVINILSLSASPENLVADSAFAAYSGDGSAEVVVMDGDKLTVTLNYSPDNATNTKLTATYLNGKSLIKDAPDSVVAGKPFTLTFLKESERTEQTAGCEVEIKFTNPTKLVNFTLKVLVDSVLNEEDYVFDADNTFSVKERDDGDVFVTRTNSNQIKTISIKGVNANRIAPKRGAVVFNDTTINSLRYKTPYVYFNTNNCLQRYSSQDGVTENDNGTYEFNYALKAMESTDNASVEAYIPKTFAMMYDFDKTWLDSARSGQLDSFAYDNFQAFVNKYFKYIFPSYVDADKNVTLTAMQEAGKEYFALDDQNNFIVIRGDGQEQQRLLDIMDNIFVHTEQSIRVHDVEIGEIEVKDQITYQVFSENNYNNETVTSGDSLGGVDYLGVNLLSQTLTETDNQLLAGYIGRVEIAPYVKVDDDDISSEKIGEYDVPQTLFEWYSEQSQNIKDEILKEGKIVIAKLPKIVGSDGREYFQFVYFEEEEEVVWYEYCAERIEVTCTKSTQDYTTTAHWVLTALQPTINDQETILVYWISSIGEEDSQIKFAKTKVVVDYTQIQTFGFSNTDTKMIFHDNSTTIEAKHLKNTTAYMENGSTLINSITLQQSDVVTNSSLSSSQYRVVHFFMVKDSNTYLLGEGAEKLSYDVFEVQDEWVECKLMDINGEYINMGEDKGGTVFYDLGSRPTLNVQNITSIDEDDRANKVEIIACIMQTDIGGAIMTQNSDETLVERVVRYSSDRSKKISVDHFITKLYAYRVVTVGNTNYFIPAGQSLSKWVKDFDEEKRNALIDSLKEIKSSFDSEKEEKFEDQNVFEYYNDEIDYKVCYAAYELDAYGKVKEDTENVCKTYLNQKAVENFYTFFNSGASLRYELAYNTEGVLAPDSDKITPSEIVNVINQSNIVYGGDDGSKDYIEFTLKFQNLEGREDDLKVTRPDSSEEITLGTDSDPIQLNFILYLLPITEENVNNNIPYYDLPSTTYSLNLSAKTTIHIAKTVTQQVEPEL